MLLLKRIRWTPRLGISILRRTLTPSRFTCTGGVDMLVLGLALGVIVTLVTARSHHSDADAATDHVASAIEAPASDADSAPSGTPPARAPSARRVPANARVVPQAAI